MEKFESPTYPTRGDQSQRNLDVLKKRVNI